MKILEVSNICKNFGNLKAVDNISFSIEEGIIFGALGPNGAGKTTTIRMIMNIIMPDSGDISIMGVSNLKENNNLIGYLPEERGIYRKMKVEEVLMFFSKLKSMPRQEAKEKIQYWLERFELLDWRKKKVEELSKGMQQKLQFIATIMYDPKLLILDEPFLGLDPVNSNLLKDVLLEMKQKGITIIFSTHQMESAEKLCDEIILINKGRSVLAGDLKSIKSSAGKHHIQLEYNGNNNFLTTSDKIKKYDDFGQYVEVELHKEVDPQSFLKEIVPQIEIKRFEIIEPSLNDIFIETVKD
ncbi:ABC transporter ATP-binding protein [Candidatus Cloacimonadota bacterium]